MEFDIIPMPAPRQNYSERFNPTKRTQRYRKFQNLLFTLAKQKKYKLRVPLSLTFVMPMPKSWTKKKKEEMNGQPHTQRPDLDNLIKAFKDSLLREDSMVYEYGKMRKEWGEVGKIIVMDEREVIRT